MAGRATEKCWAARRPLRATRADIIVEMLEKTSSGGGRTRVEIEEIRVREGFVQVELRSDFFPGHVLR